MLDNIKAMDEYQLARIAEVSVPEPNSPYGARFLRGIRNMLVEIMERQHRAYPNVTALQTAYFLQDTGYFAEIVDTATPVNTYSLMRTYVDLEAYYWVEESVASPVETAALALAAVGDNLLLALTENME